MTMNQGVYGFLVLLMLGRLDMVLSAPTINSFDKVAVLYEETTVNEVLSTIDCSDPDGDLTDVRVDSMNPNSPCTNCFEVLDCGTVECLQYRAGVGTLSHAAVGSYLITISCVDNNETPATEIIEIIIKPNSPPYFQPDVLYVDNPMNAATPAGDLVYDVQAQDDENDDLVYTMNVLPASVSSAFTINSINGEITTTVDLRTLCRCYVTLEVTIDDGKSEAGPLVINVFIEDSRVAPIGINLDTTVQIPEDSTGTAYIMRFQDGDNDALTYTITTTNTDGWAQFSVTDNEIDIAATLDYEQSTLRVTDLEIYASDDYCQSPTYTLRLEVTDVNEPPVLTPEDATIEICEGQGTFTPPYTVTDEDEDDTTTWEITSTNVEGYYTIDQATGVLGTAIEYDVDPDYDKPVARASQYTYTVKVRDKGSLSDQASVTVNFLDCNDNAPRFLNPSYGFATTDCTAAGTILGYLDAEDADSDREQNNVLSFSGSGGSVSIGTGGEVFLDTVQPAGTVVTFDAYVTDQGQTPGPLTSINPAWVSVRFLPCPVVTTTAAPTTASSADTTVGLSTAQQDNLAWIVVAALLTTILLALLGFMLWKYGLVCADACKRANCNRCNKLCKPKPKRPKPHPIDRRPPQKPPSPPEAPRQRPGPGFLFGFWKERYPNDDMTHQPDRQRVPSPGDIEPKDTNTYDPVDEPQVPVTPPPPKTTKCKGCSIL